MFLTSPERLPLWGFVEMPFVTDKDQHGESRTYGHLEGIEVNIIQVEAEVS
jgi:hypothetical protein